MKLGPVHAYVAPPAPVAVKLIVLPEHTGLLLPTVGAAGVVGSVNTIGPATGADGQPVDTKVAMMFVYDAAFNPVIITWPVPFAVMLNGPCAVPFLLYVML